MHADHITGSGRLKNFVKTCKSVISSNSKAVADIHLKDGNLANKITTKIYFLTKTNYKGDKIKFGNEYLHALATPGHTNGCMSFVSHSAKIVFSGDALLIRGCGRTDFQQGNSEALFNSIHDKILSLPDEYSVFPGHDYVGLTSSSIGEEKNTIQG